ncbi:MAG TPA: DUF4902 domain-containing protein [Burkholderiaceae bacterium]
MHTPTLSRDGYIRLSLHHLSQLPLIHLDTATDDAILDELRALTVPAAAAGYCEWCSVTTPSISIGWSWFIHSQSAQILPAPEAVRSNVMFVDAQGYDLGQTETSMLFTLWLATHEWKGNVAAHTNAIKFTAMS